MLNEPMGSQDDRHPFKTRQSQRVFLVLQLVLWQEKRREGSTRMTNDAASPRRG